MKPRRTTRREKLEAGLADWASDLDVEALQSASTEWAYLLTAAFLACIVFVGAHTEVGHGFFGFESFSLFLWYVPTLALGLLQVRRLRAGLDSVGIIWLLELVVTTSGVAYLFLVMSQSRGVSGVITAAVVILSSGFVASVHRSTPKRPFMPLAYLVFGCAAGLLVDPGQTAALAIVIVTSVISTMISLIVGGYAKRLHQVRAREGKLDAVVRAQLLTELAEASPAADATAIAAHYHDLSNNVQAAVATLEVLKFSLADDGLSHEATAVRLDRLSQSLNRVAELAASVRHTRSNARPAVEPVSVFSVVEGAAGSISHLFPSVRICISEPVDLYASVLGGKTALARVMENLVINACEGDGRTRASEVIISVSARPDGATVAIRVQDDGPGFPSEGFSEHEHMRAYFTTKPSGSGLGLYAVNKIVRGSAGSVVCRNVDGARVDVTLPRAFPPAATLAPKARRPMLLS